MKIRNVTKQGLLAEKAVMANRFWQRFKGLLGTTALPAGEGLVIQPCSSIHTFGMKYAIDVVFVGRNGIVNKVVSNIEAGRFAIGRESLYVIELPSGTIAATDTQPGDRIELLD